MEFEIENPLDLLLEFTYMNGHIGEGIKVEIPNINKLMENIRTKLEKEVKHGNNKTTN